ncbi:MAG: LamG-like jellyroll fold domain-containing protein, partial [Candidatus Altiarchaeota archaeon]
KWHHVAGVANATHLILYLDGRQKAIKPRMYVGDISVQRKLSVGGWEQYTKYFNGDIDSLRIYNRALSESEVRYIVLHACDSNTFTGYEPVEVSFSDGIDNDCNGKTDGDEFIFSFFVPLYREGVMTNISYLDEIMDETQMTHVGVTVGDDLSYMSRLDTYIASAIRGKYNLLLFLRSGRHTNGDKLEVVTGVDDSKFLASCPSKTCQNYKNEIAISPSYRGELWANTLDNARSIISRATEADLIVFDTEVWRSPTEVENAFDYCGCPIVSNSIGNKEYIKEWRNRGSELKASAKEINPFSRVYFYGEMRLDDRFTKPRWKGGYLETYETIWMPNGTGDSSSPSLYYLPDLKAFEDSMESINMTGAVVWVSFSYSSPHSDQSSRAILFNESVSREAGRLLRRAGARGFFVFQNPFDFQANSNYPSWAGDYWIAHIREMILGFNEGLTYVEQNKIKNPNFASFKTEVLRSSEYVVTQVQFSPTHWTWTDTNPEYINSNIYTNIDKQANNNNQVYILVDTPWRHTRFGDIGNRTIRSDIFVIEDIEAGTYTFSIRTNASVTSSNGNIRFFIEGNSNDVDIGSVQFNSNWNEFTQSIILQPGNYRIKIIIEDNTEQTVNVSLGSCSLVKVITPL